MYKRNRQINALTVMMHFLSFLISWYIIVSCGRWAPHSRQMNIYIDVFRKILQQVCCIVVIQMSLMKFLVHIPMFFQLNSLAMGVILWQMRWYQSIRNQSKARQIEYHVNMGYTVCITSLHDITDQKPCMLYCSKRVYELLLSQVQYVKCDRSYSTC